MTATCIKCHRPIGSHPRAEHAHHPLSCGDPVCDVFARGYVPAEREIAASMDARTKKLGSVYTSRDAEAERIRRGEHRGKR